MEKQKLQIATFGAGCFWDVEEAFRKTPGVVDTAVGYSGGSVPDPTYEMVCTDQTGHAEVVQVKFDPDKIFYEDLLKVYWSIHDPTQFNRQGPDVGRQYRSVIFYHNDEQKRVAEKSKVEMDTLGKFAGKIVSAIEPAQEFYPAEEYHQQYIQKNR